MDITGFPKDCRKMLVAFVTQQRITVERKIRKDNAENSLYSSFSLPNRLMIGTGKHSNKKVAAAPIMTSAAIMVLYIFFTR